MQNSHLLEDEDWVNAPNLDYRELDDSVRRYPKCAIPYLLDPVRIPEIETLINGLPCLDTPAQAIIPQKYTRPKYIHDVPEEVYFSILNELPLSDVPNVVASSFAQHEVNSSWWWKRTLTDMPCAWELARVAPRTDIVDWAKIYAHLKEQDRSDVPYPYADKLNCNRGPWACNEDTTRYRESVSNNQGVYDVVVLEDISEIKDQDLEALLAVRTGVDRSVKPGKGTEGAVQLQGELPTIPVLANRRQI